MKRLTIAGIAITILLIIGGCGSNPTPTHIAAHHSTTSVGTVDALDITIREASDYLNDNIPRGNRIVILYVQSNSPDLSEYIIDELIANAVNDRIFSVVDRQQLEAIRAEQDFQLSGEVDDNQAIAIGRFLGAQTIVSGAVNRLGAGHRIRIRALDVQTAQVLGQFNRNIASSPIITSLMENNRTAHIASAPVRRGTVWEGNGHSYEVINISMSWTDARRFAEELGGHLATITSPAEQAFIENLLLRYGNREAYWLGGYLDNARRFRWVTGEPFVFTNWMPGEPTGWTYPHFFENRLQILRVPHPSVNNSRLGQWNDTPENYHSISVSFTGFGFIIEWD